MRTLGGVLFLVAGFPMESSLGFRFESWSAGDPPFREGITDGPGQSRSWRWGVTSTFFHGVHSRVLWEQEMDSVIRE